MFERGNPYARKDPDGHDGGLISGTILFGIFYAINYVMVNGLANPVSATRSASSIYLNLEKGGYLNRNEDRRGYAHTVLR